MHRLVPTIFLLSAFTIPIAAHADTFNFSATGSGGTVVGSGVLTGTPEGGGAYLITGITGTGVTGFFGPGGFNGNDNMLFPAATPTLDAQGFSFSDANGPNYYDVNIFNNGTGYFAYLKDEDNFTQTVPVSFALAASTVPEPTTLALLGTGLLVMVGAGRRKIFGA